MNIFRHFSQPKILLPTSAVVALASTCLVFSSIKYDEDNTNVVGKNPVAQIIIDERTRSSVANAIDGVMDVMTMDSESGVDSRATVNCDEGYWSFDSGEWKFSYVFKDDEYIILTAIPTGSDGVRVEATNMSNNNVHFLVSNVADSSVIWTSNVASEQAGDVLSQLGISNIGSKINDICTRYEN